VKQAVAEGLLLRGGGHAMAAGITLDLRRLGEFQRHMESAVGLQVRTAMAAERALVVDALTSAEGANLELLELLERAGPFGAGHPEPILALPAQQIAYAEVAGGAHVRVSLTNGAGTPLKAMAFRAAETAVGKRLLTRDGGPLHVAGSLTADSWQGRVRPSLRIIDVAEPAQAAA
jgi:single-stranded-DNA-specific exonuclease